jgi:hypothetical protein
MADVEYMLTTIDNPFDPFTQYDDWFAWDFRAGYHTPGALARQVISSDDLSDADQRDAINQAVDEMVDENVLGVYKKVSQTIS